MIPPMSGLPLQQARLISGSAKGGLSCTAAPTAWFLFVATPPDWGLSGGEGGGRVLVSRRRATRDPGKRAREHALRQASLYYNDSPSRLDPRLELRPPRLPSPPPGAELLPSSPDLPLCQWRFPLGHWPPRTPMVRDAPRIVKCSLWAPSPLRPASLPIILRPRPTQKSSPASDRGCEELSKLGTVQMAGRERMRCSGIWNR